MASSKQVGLPKGIRWREAAKGPGGKKNSGHGSTHAYGRQFWQLTCPSCRTTYNVGVDRVTVCGNCGKPLPRNGYTR
jgi:hypothetical protein